MQECLDQRQYPAIAHAFAHPRHQPRVWDGVEVARQIGIHHMGVAGLEQPIYVAQRIFAAATRTKPTAHVQKLAFEDRFDDEQCRLHDAIFHRRDAQGAHLARPFGYLHSQHGHRGAGLGPLVVTSLQRCFPFSKILFRPCRKLFDALPVYAGRARVRGHLAPRRLQHYWLINLVDQAEPFAAFDAVYRSSEGAPVFHEARAPTGDELQALLAKIITRILKCLTRQGALVEAEGMTYLGEIEADHALTPLQAASCTYRIALGPRAGQKVLSLQSVPSRSAPSSKALCANAHGFSRTGDKSLHAAVRCGTDQRQALEQLCRYITRPAIVNERLKRNRTGQVVLQLKSAYQDGTTHIVMSPLEFLQRLAALVPRPRLHLIRFHGVA